MNLTIQVIVVITTTAAIIMAFMIVRMKRGMKMMKITNMTRTKKWKEEKGIIAIATRTTPIFSKTMAPSIKNQSNK